MKPLTPPPLAWLSRGEKAGLVVFLLLILGFGVLVEFRSAFLQKRKTDLNVYLRAAWALRAGENPYDFTTFGESHYNYPPLLAILLIPLANKPSGTDGPDTFPFAVSTALWYILGVLAVAWSTHLLATALEQVSLDAAVGSQPRGCRRWWLLRVIPLLVCLPGIARTLALGQVDLLVLLLVCGTIAAALRGRSWRAGFCLAGAICIKLIPAFLLLYPLWRRDARWLAGSALGLALGWGVLPAVMLGPARAWDYHHKWTQVVVLPSLGCGEDRSRETDLTGMARVHNQSLVGIFHAFRHPLRNLRPARPSLITGAAALLVGAVLTFLTLLAVGRRADDRGEVVIGLGSLVAVMLLVAPVCHPHYFCHWLPLVSGLLGRELERCGGRGIGLGTVLLFAAILVANTLTSIPGLEVLRECGVATMGGIVLWGTGVRELWLCGSFLTCKPERTGRRNPEVLRKSA
jgi:hypothetical protein